MNRKDNPLLERAKTEMTPDEFWEGVWLGLACWVLAMLIVGGMLI